jgi:beta-RFAP synthase
MVVAMVSGMDSGAHTEMAGGVRVETPTRLHLGFVDLNGGLGRRFGSLGLTIDGYATRVRVTPAARDRAEGPEAGRALAYARRVLEAAGHAGAVRVRVESTVPAHQGLGSGTQLGLAVGCAVDRLFGLGLGTRGVARLAERGARSGIGIGAFDQGGFLVDGGRGAGTGLPPVIARHPFPDPWRVVLLLDARGGGLHGPTEAAAFRELPEFPAERAAHLGRLVLLGILPALAEADFEPFARGVGELQRTVGDHFAPAQGGRFTSPAVAAALAWCEARGLYGVGQSSWGPTGFVLVPDADAGSRVVAGLRRRFGELGPLRCRLVAARNHGGRIDEGARPERLRRVT